MAPMPAWRLLLLHLLPGALATLVYVLLADPEAQRLPRRDRARAAQRHRHADGHLLRHEPALMGAGPLLIGGPAMRG